MPWSEGGAGVSSGAAGLPGQAAAGKVKGRQTAVSGEVAWWTAVAPVGVVQSLLPSAALFWSGRRPLYGFAAETEGERERW
jgi:hypothetical protein